MDAIIELEISAGPVGGTFTVHVLRSLAGGEPRATISLDVADIIDDLPKIEASVLASSVSARRVMTSRESAIQEIGVRLFDAVFAGKVGECYRASVAVAAERGLVPRLTLRLAAPELAVLPWEALYDTDGARYISRKEPLVLDPVEISRPPGQQPVVAPPIAPAETDGPPQGPSPTSDPADAAPAVAAERGVPDQPAETADAAAGPAAMLDSEFTSPVRSSGSRRRGVLIIAAVAAVLVIAGVAWAAIPLLNPPAADRAGGGSSESPSPAPPAPTPTTLAAVQLDVLAALAWTPTGVLCDEGDALAITATGTILHEPVASSTVSPDGLADPLYHQFNVPGLPDAATAGLIGSLDGEQQFFFVGSSLTYTCPRAGELYLGINDVGLDGNSGWWQATVIRTDNP